jgi:hypothetical protein
MGTVISALKAQMKKNNQIRNYTDCPGQYSTTAYISFDATGPYSIGVQKSFYFNSDTQLDWTNCKIKAIELISSTTLQRYIDPVRINAELDGQDIATGGGMLYISNLKREIIAMIPLYVLIRNNNDGKFVFTQFEDQIWQNCYVEFTDMAGLFNNTKGLMFRIYYDQV